jgi:tRNA pseudouridine13 synthase
VPNYFDDPRFGSVGRSGELIAKPWCLEDYERALFLAVAEPNRHDRPRDKEEKRLLRAHWGDFAAAKEALGRSSRRSTAQFLTEHPGDYRGAFARLPKEMRDLWRVALQSHVWNRMLALSIAAKVPRERTRPVELVMGPAPFFTELEDGERTELQALALPLPSARAEAADTVLHERMQAAALECGIALEAMRIHHPKDEYFGRGERRALLLPAGAAAEAAPDDLYPKKKKLALAFDLERGSYATMVVKRLTEV